jgi:hypothetical protein
LKESFGALPIADVFTKEWHFAFLAGLQWPQKSLRHLHLVPNSYSYFADSIRKMKIGEVDIEEKEEASAISEYPSVGRGRVLAKIAALERSTKSEPQFIPGSSISPLTSADLLHYHQPSGEEIGRHEHDGGSQLDTTSEWTSDTSDEADESTTSGEHESNTSDQVYSLDSDVQSEDGGESSATDEGESHTSDSYSPESDGTDESDLIHSAEGKDQHSEEMEKRTRGSEHNPHDVNVIQPPKVPNHQLEVDELRRVFGKDLTERVLEYIKDSTIAAVYGDFLSSSRSRRYEPKWPMHPLELEPPLHNPASQAEADAIFEELYKPLRGWDKMAENQNLADTNINPPAIFDVLSAHELKKKARPLPEECSGNFLLYHNFPDAAKEVTVWSWINNVRVAIQQGELELAGERVDKAATLAADLDYKPLVSKCSYWKGRVMAGLGDRRCAAECFLDAFHCFGVYQEGELLSKQVEEYKLDILEVLDEQEARNGKDEWSRQARRALTGLDPWFRPLGELARQPSYLASASNVDVTSPEENLWGVTESNEGSPGSQPSSEKRYEDYLSQVTRYAEPWWFGDVSLRPRKVDWALVAGIEEAAQNSGYVRQETLYRVCEGFSPAFEDMIRGEKFTDGFDNYPDMGHSTAWKVLNYTRVKAKLKRPRVSPEEDEEELSPLAVGVGVTAEPGLSEATPQHSADILTGIHDLASEELPNQRAESVNRGPPLTINTAFAVDRADLSQNVTKVTSRTLRVHVTAEEKIAAFQHNLLHEDYNEGKSRLRLELEKNHEWILDMQQQQSKFDQDVQEVMARFNIDQVQAEGFVSSRNEEYLRDIWGSEGVEPPTPTATRLAREEEHTRLTNECLNPFKLELICMTYRLKHGVYRRLPREVQDEVAEPTKPAHIIAYLEQVDKLRAETDDDSLSESPAVASKPSLADREMGATEHDYGSPIAPLRPHQGSSQTSATKLTVDRYDEHGDPIVSAISNSSTANLQTYAEITRLLGAPLSRQLKAKLGIDAMSKAMRKARLRDEEIRIEQLVEIGEMAIGGKLNLSRPKSRRSLCLSSEIYQSTRWEYAHAEHESDE